MLSEVAHKELLRGQIKQGVVYGTRHLLYCTFCQVIRYALSRAGLHPQLLRPHNGTTGEITGGQSALAPSVRRVYMTMLTMWGDFKKNLLLAVTYISVTVCFCRGSWLYGPVVCLLVLSDGRFSFVFTFSICTNDSFYFVSICFYLFLYFGQN